MFSQKPLFSNYYVNSASMSGGKKWINRLNLIIDKNLDNPFLNNQQLAEILEISERNLFRKINELASLSPQKYISQYRLKQGLKYLKNGKYRTVKETAYAVGFRSSSYFIRQFEKEFGIKPLQVLKEAGWR